MKIEVTNAFIAFIFGILVGVFIAIKWPVLISWIQF